MIFLYTGANSYQGVQQDPNLSLGGFISGTTVPNNGLNNIFSDISYQTAKQKHVEVKGLILKNTIGIDTTDVTFGYTYPINANFKIEVAFVTINISAPTLIEKIPNATASPYVGVFQEANVDTSNSIDNSVSIGPLLNGASIAVWLRRTLTGVFTPQEFTDVDAEIAYWKTISDPNFDATQLTNIILKYTTA